MSDLLERPIDDVLDTTTGDEPPHTAPLILVEYRDRGAAAQLVAMLVVVIASLAITSHRRLTPPKVSRMKAAAAPVLARAAATADLPTVPTSDVPSVRTATPDPSPPVQPALTADTPLVADLTVTEDSATHDEPAVPPAPPHAVVAEASMLAPAAAPPSSAPHPSAEEVEREIQREAEEREAQLEEMQRLKPEVREIRERERPQRMLEERISFRKELRAILKAGGDDAGRSIAELCDQYGTELADEQRMVVERQLRRSSFQAGPRDRVALFRSLDVPEPLILKDLAYYWTLRLGNARNGLRDADAVRVTAAKHLLSIPLTKRPESGLP